ncbi:hypothetical protein DQ04_22411000 [Trypanosoma grayi]|uniref:hypothetical protein n=1 Tax=Trypanosoma grayi TaxID=71804 RepID=UPI0004F4752D|nr:hypothetical protein DQ04_22411000 [Trypanosoma grayi]KEG05399.1 hypothetical protein DQ04_22411000 [Trypanosoma grayi]
MITVGTFAYTKLFILVYSITAKSPATGIHLRVLLNVMRSSSVLNGMSRASVAAICISTSVHGNGSAITASLLLSIIPTDDTQNTEIAWT